MNLDRHVLPLLGSWQVSEIRPRLVASFLVHLADKGLAPGTVRKVRTVLSAVMSYAVAMEYVESNPVMKVLPPELDAEERVAPTLEETAALILAAECHRFRLPDLPSMGNRFERSRSMTMTARFQASRPLASRREDPSAAPS